MRTAVLAVFGVLAMTVIILSSLVFYPFEPFSISGFETTPGTACPLENVGAAADITVEDGWDLRKLTIVSTWEPVRKGAGLPVSGGIAVIPEPSPALGKTTNSPLLRVAPQTPGEYRLRSEADMVGTFGEDSPFHGWPKIQSLQYDAKNTLWVLPADSAKCKEGT